MNTLKPSNLKFSKKVSICTYTWAIMLNWFNCKFNKSKDNSTNVLRKKLSVVNTFQDYTYLLRKINELEILKKVVLNERQLLCFDYLAKPYNSEIDLSLTQSFSVLFNSEQINKENIINYFSRVLNEFPLGEYDEKMFKYLNDEMKEEILKKVNK
jgi:hypothetical protein